MVREICTNRGSKRVRECKREKGEQEKGEQEREGERERERERGWSGERERCTN